MQPVWLQTTHDEKQQKAVFQDEETQKNLNKPLAKTNGMSEEDRQFLALLVDKIESGEINEYRPETLVNKVVYEKLSEERQGKVDLEAMNLLADIRQIKDLHDAGYNDTYQMEYMVATLRATKERLEYEGGDLFII